MSRTLKKPINKNIGNRLKLLRNNRNLSLSKVAELLKPYVNIQLEGKSGETRISEIENSTANLTLELAVAYSRIFDVSLEYLLCLSNNMKPENKTVKETLGLSDIAIAKIRNICTDEVQIEILNVLFESEFMLELIGNLESFVYTSRFYNSCITRSFDDRKEDDTEFVKLLPRWKLDKSVSTSIDKIAKLLENGENLKSTIR